MLAKRKRVRVAPAPLSGDEADREPILDDERPASAGVRSQGHQAWGVQHDNTSQALPDMGDGGSLAGVSIHSQDTVISSVSDREPSARLGSSSSSAVRPTSSSSKKTLLNQLKSRGRIAPTPTGPGEVLPMEISPMHPTRQRNSHGAAVVSSDDEVVANSSESEEADEDSGEDTTNSSLELFGETQRYIPYHLAQQWITKMGTKMHVMKTKHIEIAQEMDVAYRRIEADTEEYFEAFARQLREQHKKKVANFREVLALTREEQKQKEKEWKQTVEDLVAKNKSLAHTKQSLLSQVKRLFEQLQAEKEALQQQMTDQLNTERQARAADIQNLCEQHNKEVEASAVVLQHKIEEKDEEWEKNLIASQETWDKAAKGQCQDVVTQSTELFSQFNVTLQERLDALQQRILLANQHIQKTSLAGQVVAKGSSTVQQPRPVSGKGNAQQAAMIVQLRSQLKKAEEQLKATVSALPELSGEQKEGLQQSLQSKEEELHQGAEAEHSEQLKSEILAMKALLASEIPVPVPSDDKDFPSLELSSPESLAIPSTSDSKALYCLFQLLQVLNGFVPSEVDIGGKLAACAAELESLNSTDMSTDETGVTDRLQEAEARNSALLLLQNIGDVSDVGKLVSQLGLTMPHDPPEFSVPRAQKSTAADSSSSSEGEDGEDDYDDAEKSSKHRKRSKGDELVQLAAAESEEIKRLEAELARKENDFETLKRDFEAQQVEMLETKNLNSRLASEGLRKEALVRAEFEEQLNQKAVSLLDIQSQLKQLEDERLQGIPVDTAEEIMRYRDKLALLETDMDDRSKAVVAEQVKCRQLEAKVSDLKAQVEQAEKMSAEYKAIHAKLLVDREKEVSDYKAQLKSAKAQQSSSSSKTITALETKIKELETEKSRRQPTKGAAAAGGAAGGKKDKEHEELKTKLKTANGKVQELTSKCKQLEKEVVAAGRGGGSSMEDKRELKKKEKELKELNKQLEIARRQLESKTASLTTSEEELKRLSKELKDATEEAAKLKAEMAKLGAEAKSAAANAEKVKVLQDKVKQQGEELATALENYNTERVMRKKYHNIIEDMKGKIRVYCRARPLSKSEIARGNHSVIGSPDEYTITVQSPKGTKEYSFDQVFTPDHSQEKVFEDTGTLIQSAMDGFNVCIFAYGQTGSGKTYTMIGADTSLDSPVRGIAPRAFLSIFDLIEANRKSLRCEVSVYMLELYNDKLLDLFAIGKDGFLDYCQYPAKLDIKKNKKGMVVVTGCATKEATSAVELLSIFEAGSKNRHVASTQMNAESSRSHLVIGIVITSTNLSNGNVVTGKLSLVDLAGSERAAKTGATAEQMKEAQSINKSLSALGDVISALSTGQGHIPYRNNKLTMLMQDSLGGNAKTLMFVNISPADYNCDETIVSLVYASRVKLITNDASKNADNKEIARLKAIISKLKKGEAVDEEDI